MVRYPGVLTLRIHSDALTPIELTRRSPMEQLRKKSLGFSKKIYTRVINFWGGWIKILIIRRHKIFMFCYKKSGRFDWQAPFSLLWERNACCEITRHHVRILSNLSNCDLSTAVKIWQADAVVNLINSVLREEIFYNIPVLLFYVIKLFDGLLAVDSTWLAHESANATSACKTKSADAAAVWCYRVSIGCSNNLNISDRPRRWLCTRWTKMLDVMFEDARSAWSSTRIC